MTAKHPIPEGVGECVGALRAARILRVSDRTVERMADDGRLPVAYWTPGGHRRFRLADIEAARNPTDTEGSTDDRATTP